MIPELTNHLWQSTGFALLAALLTLAFRRNRAQVRYWLWFSASVKFLVPFALLLVLGSRLDRPSAAPHLARVAAPTVSYNAIEISEPLLTVAPARPAPASANWPLRGVFAVWAFGFAAIAAIRLRAWRSLRRTLSSSEPVDIPAGVEIRAAHGVLEPGIVGWLRPILFLPEGIADRLTPAQLSAVLAHELAHVRRRDNLLASIHMIVEAIFWFHPMIWWIGGKLVEERERACDEEVLRAGNEPLVYAESILEVCKFYVESPLACMSGVTGAEIKLRVHAILSGVAGARLSAVKKLALTAVAVAAVAAPIVIGVTNAPYIKAQSAAAANPAFQVASIKLMTQPSPIISVRSMPGGALRAQAAPVLMLIVRAYQLPRNQVVGGPSWIQSDGYNIEAKPESATDENGTWLMTQALLTERFHLKVHRETREMQVYELAVAKNGLKLPPHADGSCVEAPPPDAPFSAPRTAGGPPLGRCGSAMIGFSGNLNGGKLKMEELARALTTILGKPVLDHTGFTGEFDAHLTFARDQAADGLTAPVGSAITVAPPPAPNPDKPSIFAALQEQLGLKLSSTKAPVEVLVIDHVERPTEN